MSKIDELISKKKAESPTFATEYEKESQRLDAAIALNKLHKKSETIQREEELHDEFEKSIER